METSIFQPYYREKKIDFTDAGEGFRQVFSMSCFHALQSTLTVIDMTYFN